jgi:hypothetical protein
VNAADWVRGIAKGGSCQAVCAGRKSSAVSSGAHPNGGVYDVCLGVTYGDGIRPGYNLSNWNSDSCAIAFQSREDLETNDNAWCLCDQAQAAEWIETIPYTSCSDVCAKGGKKPFHTGYHHEGDVYSVCAADMGGDGWRVGYQLNSYEYGACVVAYGGKEVVSVSEQRFRCLCDNAPPPPVMNPPRMDQPSPPPPSDPCGGTNQKCCSNHSCNDPNAVCTGTGSDTRCTAPGVWWNVECACSNGAEVAKLEGLMCIEEGPDGPVNVSDIVKVCLEYENSYRLDCSDVAPNGRNTALGACHPGLSVIN